MGIVDYSSDQWRLFFMIHRFGWFGHMRLSSYEFTLFRYFFEPCETGLKIDGRMD